MYNQRDIKDLFFDKQITQFESKYLFTIMDTNKGISLMGR
jgi:hypothetical protein